MSIVNVAVTSTPVLAAGRRDKIILTNEGANNIWLSFNAAAVVDEGFKIASGERIILDAVNLELNTPLNGIAETGATDLAAYSF